MTSMQNIVYKKQSKFWGSHWTTYQVCYFVTIALFFFYINVTVHHDKFLIINQLDALISQIYFRNETLHVSFRKKFEKLVHLVSVLQEIVLYYAVCAYFEW